VLRIKQFLRKLINEKLQAEIYLMIKEYWNDKILFIQTFIRKNIPYKWNSKRRIFARSIWNTNTDVKDEILNKALQMIKSR